MHNEAPQPPPAKTLLWIGLAAGTTIGAWVVTTVGLLFHPIPTVRLATYIAVGLCGIAVTGWLGTRYIIQKARRDAWWDGFAAGDEPLAEVIPLRDLNGYDGAAAKQFIVSSPS